MQPGTFELLILVFIFLVFKLGGLSQ